MLNYLDLTTTDPAWNLAVEEYVFDHLPKDRMYVMLWQNDHAIIIGKHQNTLAEINESYVKEQGIRVVRRLSGGGAVYHDMGNLNFTVIADAEGDSLDFGRFCDIVIRALARVGVNAERNGRNDMTIDGKKFSGNAQYIRQGRVMHHGTILFDSNGTVLANALKVDQAKIQAKGIKSVRSRVTNVRPCLPNDMTLPQFREVLLQSILEQFPGEAYHLTDADLTAIQAMKEQRYDTWEWNFGHSPACTVTKKQRIEGCGTVEAYIDMDKGCIHSISFRGDFFAAEDPAALAEVLTGCPLEEDALAQRLQNLDISRYFMGLDTGSFLQLLTGLPDCIQSAKREGVFMNISVHDLPLEDLVGQVLCPSISSKDDPEKVVKMLREQRPGGLFVTHMTKEMVKFYTDAANAVSKVPVVICSDVENGPEIAVTGTGTVPKAMACAAAGSTALVREAAEASAAICRENGIHWTFSPVADINYNFRCPEINARAFSDDPQIVAQMCKAFVEGIQKDHRMMACVKHFPGQGMDDRNAHFCTCVNPMSREEWMSTYGMVYKTVFEAGVGSVMMAHCALPFCEEEADPVLGGPPAILSKSIMTDLLKNELGFKGCVVSDAMSMVGAVARCPLDKLAVNFLKAGGDMVLFNEKHDRDHILKAVESGELPLERLQDAVSRILQMKQWLGLGDPTPPVPSHRPLPEIARDIARRSITVQRDLEGLLPLNIPPKSKILFVNVINNRQKQDATGHEFDAMKEVFEQSGHTVDILTTPSHRAIEKQIENYEAVLINYRLDVDTYHGGTLRPGWDNIFHFWRGYIFNAKRLICTSFGDPYKLYDMPFLKTYINAYCDTPECQCAAAEVILGKIPAQGKNPVALEGFFSREVQLSDD